MKSLQVLVFTMLAFSPWPICAVEVEFMKAFDCENSYRHHSFCFATQPKNWSEKDKKQVLEAIGEWPEEALKVVTKSVKIYRMGFGYFPRSAFANIRKKDVYAWAQDKNKIFITDRFIESKKIIEGGSYTFNSYTLLHEMIHLFDQGRKRLSKTEDFLKLYSWQEVDDPNSLSSYISKKWLMVDIDQKLLEERREILNQLMATGKKNEAAKKSLEFAAEYGLPTMYASTNPAECLSELITNYLLAPNLNPQLKPEALAWLHALLRE